jgi:hypothetical protein
MFPMRRAAHLLHGILLFLLACGAGMDEGASSPDDVQPEIALSSAKLRLRAKDGGLFVSGAAGGQSYAAGSLFYVLDAKPTPSGAHAPLGIVEVAPSGAGKVVWSCKPRAPIDDATLAGPGLPALPVDAGTRLRVGKCWGTYSGQAPEAWDKSSKGMVYLVLSLGKDDGVRPDDTFDVLDDPGAEKGSSAGAAFKRIGRCAVQDIELTPRTSVCRLVRSVWPAFGRDAWTRGGFVKLVEKAP